MTDQILIPNPNPTPELVTFAFR